MLIKNRYSNLYIHCACNYVKNTCEEKYSPKYSQLFFQAGRIMGN